MDRPTGNPSWRRTRRRLTAYAFSPINSVIKRQTGYILQIAMAD
jgi:hypothetical protein